MKKAPSKGSRVSAKQLSVPQRRTTKKPPAEEMRPHYAFDYSKSRPNRFASRMAEETIAVVLDPDVATVFRSAEAVNTFLRSAISAMPTGTPPKKKRAASS
ncbi:MAG: hypothetical protein QOJ98_2753 [Acidobacteriota bacterium]|jgi:hypothetical protein|nr:hypothetical protein [Acidobacteriota bacterium]